MDRVTAHRASTIFLGLWGLLFAAPSVVLAQAGGGSGIDGVVVDSQTREPIIEGTVTVLRSSHRSLTDIDGKFSIDLAPGTYTLRSFYELYETARVENVVVRAGERTRVEILLTPDGAATQEVVVTARADRSTAATQLQVRRQAATVQDSVSAEEIARTPDSSANEAVRRVVAATIVDGQFLYVRGLGGRYTNVLLNGASLPSTDPDFPGVQLDLFPASLLESLTVSKTFTPDLPGDFVGGLMQIGTRDYPSRFQLRVNMSVGANTESTFRNVLDSEGGSLDALGFDDGGRALPDAVPAVRLEPGRNGFTPESVDEIARAFPNHWEITRSAALPDMSAGATLGDTTSLGGRPFGYLFTLGYSLQTRRTLEALTTLSSQEIGGVQSVIERERLDQESATTRALWGALASLSFEPAEGHELGLVSLWSQAASDETRYVSGTSEDEGAPIAARRLRFVERSLFFTQLFGDHDDGLPLGARLRWQLNAARGMRDEPDTRDVLYREAELGYQWRRSSGSGVRFYSELDQQDFGGSVDLTIPFEEAPEDEDDKIGSLRFGWTARLSDREFLARRFGYRLVSRDSLSPYLPAETLFGPEGQGVYTRLEERTLPADGYAADQAHYASYAMIDLPIGDLFRIYGGVRGEAFRQTVENRSPFATNTPTQGTERTDVDPLPSVGVVLEPVEDMFVRLAYGGTVARPLVRELAPFLFPDFVRRRTVEGNPDLVRTYVHNVDLRWELYPSEVEVLAASLFFKDFSDPIEQVVTDRNGNISFQNVDGARNYGAELEGRVSLGRIADSLDAFSLGANLTLVYSRVRLSEDQRMVATSTERPMAGQSPVVANLSLGFSPDDSDVSIYLYYNVFGERIEDVGRFGLPDVYEESVHQVDLAVAWEINDHFKLKASAKNLLFQSVVYTQGAFDVRRYEPGMSAAMRLEYAY